MSDETPEKKPAAKKPTAKKPGTAKKPAEPAPAETSPTEVLEPTPAPEAPVDPEAAEPTVVVAEAAKPKRKKWPWILGGVALLLVVLLVIAFFVADAIAKNYAKDYIRERIVAVLNLDPATPVDVDIEGSVLMQALAGRLNSVDVSVEKVAFGELSGAATVHAEGLPLNTDAPTDVLGITFSMPEDQVVAALGDNLSGMQLEEITLEEPEIVVKTTLDLFFFKLPVAMALEPAAEEGTIVFTPTTITLDDEDYTADELRQQLGQLADAFLAQQAVCVADKLPVALTVTDADIVKTDLVLKIDGDGATLGGSDLTTMGTCAAG
jgi:hypothetical protein